MSGNFFIKFNKFVIANLPGFLTNLGSPISTAQHQDFHESGNNFCQITLIISSIHLPSAESKDVEFHVFTAVKISEITLQLMMPSLFLPLDKLLRTTLFKIGDDLVTPLWLLQLGMAFLIVLVFSRLLKMLLKERILARLGIDQGNREAIAILSSYSLGGLGFVLVLQIYGFNLASLAVVIGSLGIGVGFGLQEMTKNLASGLVLLVEGKLRVGDYIEFDGLSGYIKEISMRSTLIYTFDGSDVVVPNSSLTSKQVINWSYQNFTGRIRLPIGVAYESDPILVTETLLNAAYIEPAVLHNPPPKVIFIGFGDSSLNFELWVWVSQIDEGISVKSSLNFIIYYNFRQMEISMPFPQRDLWLRNPETLRLRQKKQVEDLATPDLSPPLSQKSKYLSLRDLFRSTTYFRSCSDLHLRKLIELGYRKSLAASETVFHKGEQATAFYIILRGSVDTIVVELDKQIKTHGVGEIFGEVALMLGIAYATSARTMEETILFVIDKSNLEKLLKLRPDMADLIAQEFAKDQEIYFQVRKELEELGLLEMPENHNHALVWIQERFKQLFHL